MNNEVIGVVFKCYFVLCCFEQYLELIERIGEGLSFLIYGFFYSLGFIFLLNGFRLVLDMLFIQFLNTFENIRVFDCGFIYQRVENFIKKNEGFYYKQVIGFLNFFEFRKLILCIFILNLMINKFIKVGKVCSWN